MARAERALGRWWALAPLYALLAMLLTWPLVAHLGSSITYGGELVRTVPLFNLWTLEWNQLQVGHLYAAYWDAPIFFPTQGAFALSEPQPLTGLAFAPISGLSGNPVLGYNVISLLVLTLNGYAGARLARALGAAAVPSALVGALAVGLPFVAHQLGVIQLTVVFGMLLLIEAIVRWAPEGGSGPAARIGLWLGVTFLTCGYYGLLAVVGIGAVSLVLVRRDWLTRQRLADAALAAGVFAVLALPVVLGQARYTSGYQRSDDEIRELSASFGDYLRLDDRALGADAPWLRHVHEGHGLYPGTALLALGLAGLIIGLWRGDRRRVAFLFAGVCVAWLLSGGLKLTVFGWHPYEVVRAVVPGFDQLRNPARFSVLGELFLLGLAAYALDALWRWRRRAGPALAVVLALLAVAEVTIAPVRLFDPQPTARWATWLNLHTAPVDRPVMAFVPFPAGGLVSEYQETAARMVQAVNTRLTTVSGYSGLFPDRYESLTNIMYGYPREQADAALRGLGVRYLVVSRAWMNRDPRRGSYLLTHHQQLYGDSGTVIFQLLPSK